MIFIEKNINRMLIFCKIVTENVNHHVENHASGNGTVAV